VSALDGYWAAHDATLARIRQQQPDTFSALKAILDAFHPPSSGDAFFPGGGDDDLADALSDAGWRLRFFGAGYVYSAKHPATGAKLHYIEGDLYDRTRIVPCSQCGRRHDPACDDATETTR